MCQDRKLYVVDELAFRDFKWIKAVPILYKGDYYKGIVDRLLKEQIDNHNEGIMINYSYAQYQGKRNKYILKVKQMQSVDLKIIGFEEGTGKNKGTLGAIIVDYKGFKVKVGSGFTDTDRTFIWDNKENLLGRIAEIQFFEESTNKYDNSLSLRFPVFKIIREEGKEVSYY